MRSLWLLEPAIFIVGGIYTTFVMLPEIRELKDDEIVSKKGEFNLPLPPFFLHYIRST